MTLNRPTKTINTDAFVAEMLALLNKYDINVAVPTGPKPVAAPTPVETKGDLTLWSDGSVSSQAFDDYFKGYTGSGTLVRNFFFADTASLFSLNKVQLDNVNYNQANVHSLLGQMITTVDGMLQGFYATLAPNGHFDSHSVVGVENTRASREPSTSIPAILAAWRAQNYFPTVVVNTWTVV